MKFKRILYILAVILICGIMTFLSLFFNHQGTIHIALVAPLSGKSYLCGRAYLRGVKMYIDKINQTGGVNGKKIILDIYNDENDTQKARQKSLEIVRKKRAIAVIGHHYSSCSIEGGKVYNQFGIPAVTPTSTNINVTSDNPWYFRMLYNDNYQATLLANYAYRILKYKNCIVIKENQAYGAHISKTFNLNFSRLGGKVAHTFDYDATQENVNEQLTSIVQSLKVKGINEQTLIFISGHMAEGIQLIKKIRDSRLKSAIMVPDAFAGNEFAARISKLSKGINVQGFYSKNIFIASPFSYDTAKQPAQIFKQKYINIYKEEPDWRAAYAYDSAMLICKAIQQTKISGNIDHLSEERKIIRNYLSSINNFNYAVKGLTGLNFFDTKGDAYKGLSLITFDKNNLLSAYTQLQMVNFPFSDMEDPKKQADQSIVRIGDQYFYQTRFVYTGTKINSIESLDIRNQTHVLDFFIWFKYNGDIHPQNILFLNAIDPITLDKPVQKVESYGTTYEMYHVKGKFKIFYSDLFSNPGSRVLGFSFRHAEKSNYNVIYVSDISSMNESANAKLIESLNLSPTMQSRLELSVKKILFYSDIIETDTLGNPTYQFVSENAVVEFSRYNHFLQLTEKKVSLRRMINNFYVNLFLFIAVGIILMLSIIAFKSTVNTYQRSTWVIQSLCGYVILTSGEQLFLTYNATAIDPFYSQLVEQLFDILWWLISAVIINQAIKRFIWRPLEKKTNRIIPNVVINSASFFVYLMTSFGILAYVFDQKLTSLLATSGVLAMIIGLAIQSNITNIFAGIVINIEQPFRIGDWIEIDDRFIGKVIDITWRTTRVLSIEGNILSFPNSFASESPINNFSYPDQKVWVKIKVHVDPQYPPSKIKKICKDAVLSIEGLVKNERPLIRFVMREWSTDYTVLFCIDSYANIFKYKSKVYERIWNHLNRIGISHPVQRRKVHMFRGEKGRGESAINPLAVLNDISIFEPVPDDVKEHLSLKMKKRIFLQDEIIIKQNDVGELFYIIVEGSVSVLIEFDNKQFEVERLGANDFFGEISLLTGESRSASVISITDCLLYEIKKSDFVPLIDNYPEITDILSNELLRRAVNRQEKEQQYNMKKIDQGTLKRSFVSKLSSYFTLDKKDANNSDSFEGLD